LLQNFSDASARFTRSEITGIIAERRHADDFGFWSPTNENSDIGTDHGYGSVSFAIGDPLRAEFGEIPQVLRPTNWSTAEIWM